jgi:hypothetical protein
MVKRVVRWIAVFVLALFVGAGGFVAYAYRSPISLREFDAAWYHTKRGVTEAVGRRFQAQHRFAVMRAQADHIVHPIGPGRAVVLMGASPPNDSGEVYLYFGSAYISSTADLHLLPVYCWSEREKRLLWKGLQDNSP